MEAAEALAAEQNAIAVTLMSFGIRRVMPRRKAGNKDLARPGL